MNFQDYLATFPSIDHLGGLDVQDAEGKTVHHIPAVQGKLGSLKLYNALAERFDGKLGKEAAEQGLIWFAEHVADARAPSGEASEHRFSGKCRAKRRNPPAQTACRAIIFDHAV